VKLLLKHGANPQIEGGKHGNAITAAQHKNHWHLANYLEKSVAANLNGGAERNGEGDTR
jgi:hypothetical protein